MLERITAITTLYTNKDKTGKTKLIKYLKGNPEDAIQDLFVLVAIAKKTKQLQPGHLQLFKDYYELITQSEKLIELFLKEPHSIQVREFLLSLV